MIGSSGYDPNTSYDSSAYDASAYDASAYDPSSDNNPSNKRSVEELSNSPAANDPASAAQNNKRQRTGHVHTTPSKVIHIRNVPLEATEGELYTLCAPFGKVETAVIMKGKGQALIQMQEQSGATALVDFYTKNPAMLRTNQIHLQYSTRTELTNKPSIQLPGSGPGYPGASLLPLRAEPPPPGSQPSESSNESCVLLVNITNVSYPVTIELLHSVFSKYGPVNKIVTFSKTGVQAFIQFANPGSAEVAKNALDGQNIYVGSCTLRINFSTIKDLDVKYNNDKSRDFNNPYLPGSGSTPEPAYPPAPVQSPYDYQTGYYPNMPQNPYAQPGMPSKASAGPGTSPVVIVSGLNEEKITPDTLFTLFGLYGDVLKVKILFNKKDTALVQMAAPHQAEAAIGNLNSIVLQDRPIRVNYSKHATIMMPSSNPSEENVQFTKEYVGSPLHRFKSASKAFKHVCPPSSTLHVSSIPASTDEDALRDLFSKYGEVANIKFFPSEKKMALVQMASIPDATAALIALHNFRIEETAVPIRISFAKSTIYT